MSSEARKLVAEFLGTAALLMTVVASGIMGAQLAAGNAAIALLANAAATGTALYVLITLLGPVSGAQFNPAVSILLCRLGLQPWRSLPLLVLVQVLGGCLGVALAHAMFEQALWQPGLQIRSGSGLWLSEALATAGLLMVIAVALRQQRDTAIPSLVGSYIFAAYWCTSSTSFANPAVTIARALTQSFAGIAPASVAGFIAVQLLATGLVCALLPQSNQAARARAG